MSADMATPEDRNFVVGPGAALFERLSHMPVALGDIAERIAQGIRTGAYPIYVLDLLDDQGEVVLAYSEQLDRSVSLEAGLVMSFLRGRAIKAYSIHDSGKFVIVPYRLTESGMELVSEGLLRQRFPRTYKYLSENRPLLEEREGGRMRGSGWYGYAYPTNLELMPSQKIVVPDIADRAAFAFDEYGRYAFTSGYGITFSDTVGESPLYVLGLLNSSVLDFSLKRASTPIRGGYFRYFTQFVERLPIRRIDFGHSVDLTRHDRMVELVEHMLALRRQPSVAKGPQEKTELQRQIEATGRQIDRLAYELYELTDAEIRIVEETPPYSLP